MKGIVANRRVPYQDCPTDFHFLHYVCLLQKQRREVGVSTVGDCIFKQWLLLLHLVHVIPFANFRDLHNNFNAKAEEKLSTWSDVRVTTDHYVPCILVFVQFEQGDSPSFPLSSKLFVCRQHRR